MRPDPNDKPKQVVDFVDGKESETMVRILDRGTDYFHIGEGKGNTANPYTILELKPLTGRC